MRTSHDLLAACDLLADEAERYAGTSDHAGPARAVEPVGSLRPRRRLLPALAVAAVVAVAAGVVALVGVPGPGTNQAGGTTSAPRSVDVAVRAATHVRVVGADLRAGGSPLVELSTPGGSFQLTQYRRHQRPTPASGGQSDVDIAGRRGYVSCAVRTAPPSRCRASLLVWRATPGHWYLLAPYTVRGTFAHQRAALLGVARALDFDGRTVLRSAIALPSVPGGGYLRNWTVWYPGSGTDWSTNVDYVGAAPDSYLTVNASHGAPLAARHLRGRRVHVHGHLGVWQAGPGRFWYDAGHGITLVILVKDVPALDTVHRIGAFASSVRVAVRPDRVGGWFPAETALP